MTRPAPMWTPHEDAASTTAMGAFVADARRISGLPLPDYQSLHRWSVEAPLQFWPLLLQHSPLQVSGDPRVVLTAPAMPQARFFPDLKLNLAQTLLAPRPSDSVSIISLSETKPARTLHYAELKNQVAACASGLLRCGVGVGDCVAALTPNIGEAVICMLAAASVGAVFTSCSPDFGLQGIIDRFGQTKPKVLFSVNGYTYAGKRFFCLEKLGSLTSSLPDLEHLVVIDYLPEHQVLPRVPPRCRATVWDDFLDPSATLSFVPRSFNDAAYVMYSSGTTGAPKCIVHGAGGTLLTHAKELMLHSDVRAGDNIMYFTTCGWMMWNWLVSALMLKATVTLFDGAPTHPTPHVLWDAIDRFGITHFGTSPKFLGACRSSIKPIDSHKLSSLRVILSTGAPLLPEDFDYVYSFVKRDVQLSSISGGTDIIGCFMLGNPLLPVFRGEIQCLALGMDVAAFDSNDQPVQGVKGELVCRRPFVSMPIFFWNDADGSRFKQAYFKGKPGVWYHGDYIAITGTVGAAGGVVVYGRSDATLNPGGVRIGTAEIYRLVETLPEVEDSIVVGQPYAGDERVVLFVKLAQGIQFGDDLATSIKQCIRQGATPRHVPHLVVPVEKIPYTLSGKKVELAVRQVLSGETPRNLDALADPTALECYRNLPQLRLD